MAMTKFRVEVEISIDDKLIPDCFKNSEEEFAVERLIEIALAKDEVMQGGAIVWNIDAKKTEE